MSGVIDLGRLPLLARGGQADIYEFGDERILRVPRRPQDHDRIRYEHLVYRTLAGTGVVAPRADRIVDVGGVPAIVMERIRGATMMEGLRRQPLSLRRKTRELASLHLGILRHEADPALNDGKAKARYCIGGSAVLAPEAKARLLALLEELPDGGNLCHGDFHPGNVIEREGGSSVIDWSAASRGDPVSDVAHTFVLMRVVPRVPGMGAAAHRVQRFFGRALADSYRKAMAATLGFGPDEFSRWVLVKAAERTYYGLPSERDALASFLDRCLDVLASGGSGSGLYRLL